MGLQHTPEYIQKRLADVPHWFHQIEVASGIVTPGIDVSSVKLEFLDKIGLPQDFSGMRVLDIGARDGYFAFMAEQRKAKEVVALDHEGPDITGFNVAKELLGSQAQFIVENVYHLSPEKLGYFDVILFLGVLYHLRHPLLALDHVRSLMRPGAQLFVETAVIDLVLPKPDKTFTSLVASAPDLTNVPFLEVFPGASYNGDATNMFAPNMAGLRALLYEAEFEANEEHLVDMGIFVSRGYMKATAIKNDDVAFYRNRDEARMETKKDFIRPSVSNI